MNGKLESIVILNKALVGCWFQKDFHLQTAVANLDTKDNYPIPNTHFPTNFHYIQTQG